MDVGGGKHSFVWVQNAAAINAAVKSHQFSNVAVFNSGGDDNGFSMCKCGENTRQITVRKII